MTIKFTFMSLYSFSMHKHIYMLIGRGGLTEIFLCILYLCS